MKVLLIGEKISEIEALVKTAGLEIVDLDPELIISYGGDGTFFQAEHRYPSIPKLILKASRICKLCSKLDNEELLRRTTAGDYKLKSLPKLEARAGGEKLLALNDIIVHNANSRHAIRYHLSLDGQTISPHEIIGDGVVIATPLGSTGYYRSITDSYFELGLGIAFNNSTEQSDHLVVSSDRHITVTISRGPALVFADNQIEEIELNVGESVTIKQAPEQARILSF